jgi:hypothetical protein
MRRAVLLLAAGRDDDRMAAGRPQLRRKADAGQILGDILGRRLALARIGRIGRDRLDAQKANSRSRLLSSSASMRSRTAGRACEGVMRCAFCQWK